MPLINNNNKNIYNKKNYKGGGLKKFNKVFELVAPMVAFPVASRNDRYGSVVAISGDGNIMAIGGPYYSDYDSEENICRAKCCGIVNIYMFDNNQWKLKGSPIIGNSENAMLGIAIDINYDGSAIIIGAANLQYGMARYLDYSEKKEMPSSNQEKLEQATKIINIATGTSTEYSPIALIFKASGQKYAEEDKNLDILLGPVQNLIYDNNNVSPEGYGRPDIDIRCRGNVRVYKWLEGEWKNIISFDGPKSCLPENLGSSVAIDGLGKTISFGSPRFSMARRYREKIAGSISHFFAGILETGGEIVSLILPSTAILNVITGASTLTIGVLEQLDTFRAQTQEFFDIEKKHRGVVIDGHAINFIRGLVEYGIKGDLPEFEFLEFSYRTNHMIARDMGMVEVFKINNTSDYTVKAHRGRNFEFNPRMQILNTNLTDNLKNQILTNIGKPKLSGSVNGGGFFGSSISMNEAGNKFVTWDAEEKVVKTCIEGLLRGWHVITEVLNIENYDVTVVNLSMSKDGNSLAVGLPNHNNGVVLTYFWRGLDNIWMRRSNDDDSLGGVFLRGDAGDKYGNSLSLNYNGTILAVGSPFSKGNNIEEKDAGNVKFYKWNNQVETWDVYGSVIRGYFGNLLGTSIKLSNDGNTIVIGAPGMHTEFNGAYVEGEYGYAKVYKFINGDWNQNCFDSSESTDLTYIPTPRAPPITTTEMRGMKIVNLYLNIKYVDLGINIPSTSSIDEIISDVNTELAGYYNHSYIIKNKRGHLSRFDREVNVIRRPSFMNENPLILLKGDVFDIHDNHGPWVEGEVDGIISATHDVDTSEVGDYSMTFNVAITKNAYDNTILSLRKEVKVIPKKTIFKIGGTQIVRQFNRYDDLGAIIKDSDNNILDPNLIKTNITFSTDVIGEYEVIYTADHTPAVKRKVIVSSPYVQSLQSLYNQL
jgi:hypothetical protein